MRPATRHGRAPLYVSSRSCRLHRRSSMKLYYTPGACSLSPHIALREAGLPFTLQKVDLAKKTVETGEDYNRVKAKGSLPTLVLDNGEQRTEGPAIAQY